MSSDPAFKIWLEQASQITLLLKKVNGVALVLQQKRVTLEEKAIVEYFDVVSCKLGVIQTLIPKLVFDQMQPPFEHLENLKKILSTVEKAADEFLKIFHFNVNFLEQYFEYAFLISLEEELHLIAEIENLITNLEDFLPNKS